MIDLSPEIARRIIDRVGGPGQPPEYGFQFFTAGLDPYLSVIQEEYLSTLVKDGGSAFKLVVGVYGGGKTHFLYCIRDAAWKENFLTANVDLSPKETPFSQLDKVYKSIVAKIIPPLAPEELLSPYEHGIESFLRRWYVETIKSYLNRGFTEKAAQDEILKDLEQIRGVESTSFLKAFRACIRALINKNEDDFSTICQWLKGEGFTPEHKKYGILQKIEKATAFEMIRSLNQLIRQLGYSGLVIAFDEAEQQASMSTKERGALLDNLRQVIDECTKNTFQGVMIFYAVPDDNFLQGRTMNYEALRQRVDPVFDEFNPSGVKISLEKIITERIPFMVEVGRKLTEVYEIANGSLGDSESINLTIQTAAELADNQRFGDIGYKRLFVQKLIRGFNILRRKKTVPSSADLT